MIKLKEFRMKFDFNFPVPEKDVVGTINNFTFSQLLSGEVIITVRVETINGEARFFHISKFNARELGKELNFDFSQELTEEVVSKLIGRVLKFDIVLNEYNGKIKRKLINIKNYEKDRVGENKHGSESK